MSRIFHTPQYLYKSYAEKLLTAFHNLEILSAKGYTDDVPLASFVTAAGRKCIRDNLIDLIEDIQKVSHSGDQLDAAYRRLVMLAGLEKAEWGVFVTELSARYPRAAEDFAAYLRRVPPEETINMAVMEVWKDPEGNTSLEYGDHRGDASRQLMPKGSNMIHTFVATSHFDAMTKYYKFMGWGEYTTNIPEDHLPYTDKWWFGADA